MKHVLFLFLFVSFTPVFGQQGKKIHVSIQVQPELTYHQKQYSYRWRETNKKTTTNMGIAASVQYSLTDRLFVDFGLGFISRRLNTTAFLDQSKLPPPHYSATKELNNTDFLIYRTLQIPVNIGYSFINKRTFRSYVIAGVSANYLLNTYYEVGQKQYDGTYKKDYWQGVSLHGGAGADIRLIKNIFLTTNITYSFTNPVVKDVFLFSQDESSIALPHHYLRMSTGIKVGL